jgi:hypothetical protein
MRKLSFFGADAEFIEGYDGVSHSLWNDTKGQIVSIRSTIRDHYLLEQRFLCAYCRTEHKQRHGLTWDVEHVIPKASYPRFLFESENLALACKECNISKGNKNVLVKKIPKKAGLPTKAEDFLIIHPHYDVYSDHMEIAIVDNKLFHRPKNKDKGKETFIICDLVRFSYSFGEWEDFNYAVVKVVSDFIKRCPVDAKPDEIARFVSTLKFTIEPDF